MNVLTLLWFQKQDVFQYPNIFEHYLHFFEKDSLSRNFSNLFDDETDLKKIIADVKNDIMNSTTCNKAKIPM